VAAESARVEAEGSAYRAGIQLAANYVEAQQFNQASALLLEQPAGLRNWEWGFLFEQCNQDYATSTDHETPVYNLSYVPGGRLLTLGFQDHLAIRSLPDLASLHRISVADATGAVIVVSSDGSRMAIVRADGRIPVYGMEDCKLIHEFRLDGQEMHLAAFSGDGRILAVGGGDGTLYLWDCDSGTEIRRSAASEGPCEVVCVDRQGTRVLTGDQEKGRAILWDIATGEARQTFAGDLPSLSADFDRIALRSGRSAQVFEVDSGDLLFDSGELSGNLARLVISPDGLRVVALLKGGQVGIWDLGADGKVVSIRDLAATSFLSFSPDGTRIALAVEPHAVEIRRTSDGGRVQSLERFK
jgi:WD40 repeat protein